MLTGRGKVVTAVSVITLMIGLAGSYPTFIAIGISLAAAILVGVLVAMGDFPLACRQFLEPGQVSAGEASFTTLGIRNTGTRRSAPGLATNRLGYEAVAVALPTLAPQESYEVRLALPTGRRGVFDVGPVTIDRVGPLGLAKNTRSVGTSLKLVVYPETHGMAPLPTGQRRELEGSQARQPQEGGVSFHSLRDYVPGDDLRLIHWRSLAKTGDLMVRKNVLTTEPRLMVVLDTRSDSYQGDEFEDAARLAASMVDAGCEARYPVAFRTTSGLAADVTASGAGKGGAFQILAEVQPGDGDPGLNSVIGFAEGIEGLSLGAVTGRPLPATVVGLGRVRSRFDMISVVEVGLSASLGPLAIPGALVIAGLDSEEVASKWQKMFG